MQPTDLTIEILKGIREEGRKTNERLEQTNARLESGLTDLSRRVGALEKATVDGFVAVTARLEHLRDFAGERYREPEQRLSRVETRLDALEGGRRGP